MTKYNHAYTNVTLLNVFEDEVNKDASALKHY